MQYIRPPFGPRPSSSITSSSEMSSLMSATNIIKLILELRHMNRKLITQNTPSLLTHSHWIVKVLGSRIQVDNMDSAPRGLTMLMQTRAVSGL